LILIQSAFGLVVLLGIAWAISEDRRRPPWRIVIGGLALQLALAVLLLKLPAARAAFEVLNDALLALERATAAGTSLVFGYLGGAPLPFVETAPGSSFVLAFRALPLVLVVSALSALLFHWRILPWIVRGIARLLGGVTGVGGAVGVGAAANVFVGMVEAPLFVRPYLARMSRSELFMVMTCGMATIAGTVMVLYASIIGPVIPGAMGHVLTASIISAPAALVVAGLMVPPAGEATAGDEAPPREDDSAMEALTRGTLAGMKLLLNIIAMLVVLVALVSLVNQALSLLPGPDAKPTSLQGLLGYAMAPLVWLMGIPARECLAAGSLMGTKTVLNELIAYLDLAALDPATLGPRSRLIMVYAMCGFANFGSLGIMLGGLTTMVPERRHDVVSLGLKSIVAGTLATCLTGATVGVLTP